MAYTPHPSLNFATWGLATDGDLVFDGINPVVILGQTINPVAGEYQITRDIMARYVEVYPGVNVDLSGYYIRCWHLVGDVTSIIQDDGNPANNTIPGPALAASGQSSLRASGGGAGGRSTAGAGNNASTSITRMLGGAGGNGGGEGANTGGLGGPFVAPALTLGRPTSAFTQVSLRGFVPGGTLLGFNGGRGGGGGASSGAGTSGGGGSGAGVVWIFAQTLDFPGIVRAKGGPGAAASAGSAGGGGGGGGGAVLTFYQEALALPTIDVSGGAGGAGLGGGAPGADGSPGQQWLLELT